MTEMTVAVELPKPRADGAICLVTTAGFTCPVIWRPNYPLSDGKQGER